MLKAASLLMVLVVAQSGWLDYFTVSAPPELWAPQRFQLPTQSGGHFYVNRRRIKEVHHTTGTALAPLCRTTAGTGRVQYDRVDMFVLANTLSKLDGFANLPEAICHGVADMIADDVFEAKYVHPITGELNTRVIKNGVTDPQGNTGRYTDQQDAETSLWRLRRGRPPFIDNGGVGEGPRANDQLLVAAIYESICKIVGDVDLQCALDIDLGCSPPIVHIRRDDLWRSGNLRDGITWEEMGNCWTEIAACYNAAHRELMANNNDAGRLAILAELGQHKPIAWDSDSDTE